MANSQSFTASCSSVSKLSYSNWSAWTQATQGSYNAGDIRLGCFLFKTLRNSVKWKNAKISKIMLTLTFGGAGNNKEKNLSLYRGTQTSFTGSGTAMKGDAIGTVKTNGTAYNSTRTITFDATTNAAAFVNLAAWLTTDTSLTLVIYRDEESSSGSPSSNYLQVTAAEMTVEFTTSPVYIYRSGAWVNAEVQVYKTDAWVDGDVRTEYWASGNNGNQTSADFALVGKAKVGTAIVGKEE